jgi:PKD repeat protein
MRRAFFTSVVLAAAVAAAGCSLKKTETPALAGPSEFALSLTLMASPDILTQDGASESTILILARDSSGQAVKNLPLRLDVLVNSVVVDFGRLSAKNVVTGSDGRATAYYTAPAPAPESVDAGTVVHIQATPVDTDYAGALARTVSIRLVPRGVVLPPNGTPVPRFTYSPATPSAYTNVTFDASSSTDDGTIASYAWDFGDAGAASGVTATHQFRLAGNYVVTLTVTDDRGMSASTTQTVAVTASLAPTADFVFSPTSPTVNEDVLFNAATSRAATGRYLVSYQWNMGSGAARSGMTVTKSYDVPGTYNVTLTVTDDVGQTATSTRSVTVSATGPGGPNASFVFSPTSPVAGVTTVTFDASGSTSPNGIVDWTWEWNDTTHSSSGQIVRHTFDTAGTYVVRLTVTDGRGNTATTTQSVTVN